MGIGIGDGMAVHDWTDGDGILKQPGHLCFKSHWLEKVPALIAPCLAL